MVYHLLWVIRKKPLALWAELQRKNTPNSSSWPSGENLIFGVLEANSTISPTVSHIHYVSNPFLEHPGRICTGGTKISAELIHLLCCLGMPQLKRKGHKDQLNWQWGRNRGYL